MKPKGILKTVLRVLLLVICGAVLGFNIYLTNANSLVRNKLPMPFGYGAAVVLSGSMEPSMSKGDLIIVKEAFTPELNSTVVYQDGQMLVVHRIIAINGTEVTTKGDANNVADEPVEITALKGEVILAVPYAGSVVEFIKTPLGTILFIGLAILLLELPRYREQQKDTEEIEKIKAEIRRLKNEE